MFMVMMAFVLQACTSIIHVLDSLLLPPLHGGPPLQAPRECSRPLWLRGDQSSRATPMSFANLTASQRRQRHWHALSDTALMLPADLAQLLSRLAFLVQRRSPAPTR